MRRGQAVGRVVGHGHHHDEYGRAAFFGAREFFFGITEHEFAPAAVARRNIDDAVAGIEIGFEHIAGEGFVFSKGLAEVEARAADEEAVQGVAGAVSLGNEFAVHPVLLPVFAQFAQEVPFRVVHVQEMRTHAFHDGENDVGTVFFDGGVCGGLGKELRQVGVCFFIEQGADEPAAVFIGDGVEVVAVAVFVDCPA